MKWSFSPKLTGDFSLGHPGEQESFACVELPQVGAAPVRRARRGGQTRQRAQKHPHTHLLPSAPFILTAGKKSCSPPPVRVKQESVKDPRLPPFVAITTSIVQVILESFQRQQKRI